MHDRNKAATEPARPAWPPGTRWPTWRQSGYLLAAALLALNLPGAHAQSVAAGAVAPSTFDVQSHPLELPAVVRAWPAVRPAPGVADALADARLENLRGGTGTPWSDMRLSGTVGGNTATSVVTGANTITDGAFSNASGLPMVIQNSGSNVLIQNATIVNVQIQ